MSYIGTTKIGGIYLGSTEIGKAYLGPNLVYQKASSPLVFYDNLIFDGTAYIDTSITMSANYSFNVMLGNETTKAPQRVFMFGVTNSTRVGMVLNSNTKTANRTFSVWYGKSSSLNSSRTLSFSTTRYNFFLTPNRFGWGNTAYTITKGSSIPSQGLILGSIAAHDGTPYTGIMQTFYMYGSDAQDVTTASGFSSYTPVATLRPCTYYGEAGMWHVESDTFYGNSASSGTLSVSNDS